MVNDNMPPPTIPAKPLGMTGLPLAEDWARYYTTEGRSPPRGFSKPLWDEAAMRAYAEKQTAELQKRADALESDLEVMSLAKAELQEAVAAEDDDKARQDRIMELLQLTRNEVEFWTPDESNATASESDHLNRWYALRDRIDSALEREVRKP